MYVSVLEGERRGGWHVAGRLELLGGWLYPCLSKMLTNALPQFPFLPTQDWGIVVGPEPAEKMQARQLLCNKFQGQDKSPIIQYKALLAEKKHVAF